MTKLVAVVDMGTTAIRLAVAEVLAGGTVVLRDQLQQNVMLGDDVFTTGEISPGTADACVAALMIFLERLKEYAMPVDGDHIRVIATSAVREATNRETFIDRICIATGLDVEIVDEAEVSRFTYLSVQPFRRVPLFAPDTVTLIVEVGGGTTEVLAVRDGRVVFSQGHRLGALRLWQMHESHGSPVRGHRDVMEAQVARFTDVVLGHLEGHRDAKIQILAIGGDPRFAAARLHPGWEARRLVRLSVRQTAAVADQILAQSEDDLVRRYALSYPEAETLGPALMTYVRLAQALQRSFFYVTDVSMRDGVLAEMATQRVMNDEFRSQIISSAAVTGERYHVDRTHATYVREVCCRLFDALQHLHQLTSKDRLILEVAALLHEIGMYVNTSSHHKHSLYLIRNSDIFGLGTRDREMAALVARYHRRAQPKMTHEGYASLNRERRLAVNKLAAIIRVADALDRGHRQRTRDFEIAFDEGQIRLLVSGVPDLSIERLALEQKAGLFEQIYGLQVVTRPLL